MQSKIISLWICDMLGITSAFLGWINNLDNIKSNILFVVGLAYFLIRAYFYIMEKRISLRQKQLELELKEREAKK